ncbi:MAG: J domain-containing protein [Clostridia bacterium]|jgi:DnaJ-domain-containing protein 1|nr:J domain-containing protein [Clostridia bacterium]
MKGNDLLDAFEILGLNPDADEAQVRQAYHQRVKACHPDQFADGDDQRQAQEKLIQLNLAYEDAIRRLAGKKSPVLHSVSPEQAKAIAKKLMEQQRYESALLQLSHAETRDDEWYYIHGQLLMGMRQYGTAHQSFREAVRLQPENLEYRRGALDAAIAIKKHQKWPYRVAEWADGLLHRRSRT